MIKCLYIYIGYTRIFRPGIFHEAMSDFAQPRCKDLHSKSWASPAKAGPHWLPHLHRSPWRMRSSLAAERSAEVTFSIANMTFPNGSANIDVENGLFTDKLPLQVAMFSSYGTLKDGNSFDAY